MPPRSDRVLVLFRSRVRPEAAEGYQEAAERMARLAATQPGFVSIESFTAEDGEHLSLIEFESDADARAWRDHAEHREAQRRGREDFYREFRLQTCRPLRESRFRRGE